MTCKKMKTVFAALILGIFSAYGQDARISFVEQLQSSLEKNDLNGAISLFKDLPPELSSDTDMEILHASLLISAGRTDETTEIVNTLLQKNPSNKDVLELAAQAALASGNKQSQKQITDKLLAADKYNPTANIIQGKQWALKKKYKLALKNYQNALIREPENEEALFGYAQMCYYTNDLDNSKKSFEKLVAVNPGSAVAYQYLGKVAAESENYKKATEYVEKAIAIDSKNYDFYIDLGNYSRNRGKYDEAEKAWTKAIDLNPSYFLGYTYRAGLFDEQNRFEEALKDYHKIIETNPQYYYAYEEIGILEFHEKNWEGARKAFEKANEISPHTAYELMILVTLIKENRRFDAKTLSEKYMKNLDKNSIDYKMLRLYHDNGPVNAENSIQKDLNELTDKNTRGKMTYYFGMYYELRGMEQVAHEYYSKITEMQTPMFFEYRMAEWEILPQ